MLHKNIRDIQTCLQQLDSSFDSAFQTIRASASKSANKDEIDNALLIIEGALQKALWRKEEVTKLRQELKKGSN